MACTHNVVCQALRDNITADACINKRCSENAEIRETRLAICCKLYAVTVLQQQQTGSIPIWCKMERSKC